MNYFFEEKKKMLAKIRRYSATLGRIILQYSKQLSTNRMLHLESKNSLCKNLFARLPSTLRNLFRSQDICYVLWYSFMTIYELHHIAWSYIPLNQEIIKIRECIPHIGLIPKVIPLKLVGCFRGGFVCVSFCRQSEGIPPTQ